MKFVESTRYARGTVWWCKPESVTCTKPGIIEKGRPVLIISNDARGSSKIVEVVKLTSQDKHNTCPGINIPIELSNGHVNYIMCNQHYTVSTDDLFNYLYTVSENVMLKVEQGLLRCQGMEHLIDLKDNYESLKKVVYELADKRLEGYSTPVYKDTSKDIIADVVNGLNGLLKEAENRIKENFKRETGSEIDPMSMYLEKKKILGDIQPTTCSETTTEVEEKVEEKYKKKPKGFWTEGKMKEFVKDKESLPLSRVREKWGYRDNKQVIMMYSKFLAKVGQEKS